MGRGGAGRAGVVVLVIWVKSWEWVRHVLLIVMMLWWVMMVMIATVVVVAVMTMFFIVSVVVTGVTDMVAAGVG